MKKSALLVCSFIIVVASSFAQLTSPLNLLKKQLEKEKPSFYDSSQTGFDLYTKESINYLYPVYQFLLNSETMKAAMGVNGFYQTAAQFISFTGDYPTVQLLHRITRDTLSERRKKYVEERVKAFDGLQNVDAKNYLLTRAKGYNILMINEAHDNPSHRAFTFSLLEGLYKQGYRYLAMETFNNRSNHTLNKVTGFTGFYTCEPIGGELVREALQLGYKLLSYEDTLYSPGRTSTQRDSAQADHIHQVWQKDTTAKILIHAGYAHIAKSKLGGYNPLGLALRTLTGIPCLSIDQTNFYEGSSFAFENALYSGYLQKHPINKPSVALKNNQLAPIFDSSVYDVNIIHPITKYVSERPDWVSLLGQRKRYIVKHNKIPPNTFLIQAYYQTELANDKIGNLIPADQTYNKTNNGDIHLFLRKSNYVIVFRDSYYRIIKTRKVKTR